MFSGHNEEAAPRNSQWQQERDLHTLQLDKIKEWKKGGRYEIMALAEELWGVDSCWDRDICFLTRCYPWKADLTVWQTRVSRVIGNINWT